MLVMSRFLIRIPVYFLNMYFIYSIILFFILLVLIPVYFFRLRILKKQKLHLSQRLGLRLPSKKTGNGSIWIHAVSVGEVLSLQNLTRQIKTKHPDWIIYLSALTNTGLNVAKEKLNFVDSIFFIPFDFKWISRRFFKALDPDVFILAESEFWPNILRAAQKQTRGILLVNGRVSKTSWKRYSRIKFLIKNILSKVDKFLVQTDLDKKRLESIGVKPESIHVAGNLKAEINLSPLSEEEILSLKRELNIPESIKVAIAGSTHQGEEQPLLTAFAEAKHLNKGLRLILAPRHIERSAEIENLARSLSLRVTRRTLQPQDQDWDVLILDTIGELAKLYALSDIAFIGGSLVPWGGQNLLEPAFYSKPVFFGPHMENFSYIAEIFERSGAARIVCKEKDLLEMFMMRNEDFLRKMGKKAYETLQSLQGATSIALEAIEKVMLET